MSETLYAYVVSFDGSMTRKDFTDAINREPEIVNWYACLPNAVFVVSALHADPLSALIKKATGLKRFIVLDAKTDRQGWLPQVGWDFLKRPRRSGAK